MALDGFPKKACKHCGMMGHFPYQCRINPKKAMKRTEINRHGKAAKQWLITRATWIKKNPPPVDDRYWLCYLRIHESCPGQIDLTNMTLDHVVSRSRDPKLRYSASNLKPSCYFCNILKGSRSLEQVKPPIKRAL